MKSQLISLPHLGESVPAGWKKIRDEIFQLEKSSEKVLYYKEYQKICKTHEINTEESQQSLARYFHDIGIFLHFHQNDYLQKYVFINKQWILNGAYKVVDSKDVKFKKGELYKKDFDKLFSGEYKEYRLEIKEILKLFYLILRKRRFFCCSTSPNRRPCKI